MKSVISTLVRLARTAAWAGLVLVPAGVQAAGHTRTPALPTAAALGPEGDYPVTIGDPYVIGGVTYTPADTLNYDAVGYAHAGSDGAGISGAHHALPVPCYVEVTALDTGRTVLVRLDRRGPMNGKQLIELSPAAWAQLGLPSGADAPVRVRRVNPPETERALLRQGSRAPDRMETPPGLLTALRRKLGVATPLTPDEPPSVALAGAPAQSLAMPRQVSTPRPVPAPRHGAQPRPVLTPPHQDVSAPVPPVAKPAPPPMPAPTVPPAQAATPAPAVKPVAKSAPKPVTTHHEPAKPAEPAPVAPAAAAPASAPAKHLWVQVAAFSSRERAEKAAAQVGGKVEQAGKLWRVRIVAVGDDQARAALAKAKQSGYAGAIILHHD